MPNPTICAHRAAGMRFLHNLVSLHVPHQYKRRTYAEAEELARREFLAVASEALTPQEIEEIRGSALKTGGTPKDGWKSQVGFTPTEDSYYVIELHKPADERPYIQKSFVRMLVPRDRSSETVRFIWRGEQGAG